MTPLKLDKNKKYLLGCSFGPDSMALLHMLQKQGYNFSVMHINYRLREESDFEMNSLISYCEKNHIELFVKILNKKVMGNLENFCRKYRYENFSTLLKEKSFDALLIAHHMDDHLETYYLQKARQNLVKFYGIQENSLLFGMNVIRPLLGYTKEELLNYCKENQVPYAIDKSNNESLFLRNKIRHEKIEKMILLEKERELKEICNKNKEIEFIINKVKNISPKDLQSILSLNDLELAYYLNLLYNVLVPHKNISRKLCGELKKVIASNKSNIVVPISGNISFVKTFNEIYFEKNNLVSYCYILENPGKLDTPYFYLNFAKDHPHHNIYLEDYPLTIRNIKSTDEIKIKSYYVKANRLFIDWKMPLHLRKRWPVILSKSGVIKFIPRYRKEFIITPNLDFFVK